MTAAKRYWLPVAGLLLLLIMCCLATVFEMLPVCLAGLGFLVLVLLSCVSPERLLIAFVAFSIIVPVDLAVKVGSLPRTGPVRVFLAAIITGFLIRFLLIERTPIPRFSGWLPWSIAIFLFWAIISSFFSISGLQSFYAVTTLFLEQYFLLYLLVQLMSAPQSGQSLRFWVYLAASAVCAFALFEEIFHVNPFLALYQDEEMAFRGGILRVRSVFFHPIALGCFVTLLLPLIATDLINSASRVKTFMLALLALMMTCVLFLTVSRGAWMALLLESAFFIGWWCWKSLRRAVLVGVGLLVAGSALFLANGLAYDLSFTNSALINPSGIAGKKLDESSSEYYRVALAKAVLARLEGGRLIYGYGPGTFHLAEVESHYAGHDHVLTAADSYYLKVVFEYGIVGLFCFTAIMLCILLRGIRVLLSRPRHQILPVIASLAAIVAFIFENVSASMFSYSLPLTLMFWVAVASLIVATRPVGYRQVWAAHGGLYER